MPKKTLLIILLVGLSVTFFVVTYFAASESNRKAELARARERNNGIIVRHMTDWKVFSKSEAEQQLRIEDDPKPVSDDDLNLVLSWVQSGNSGASRPLAIRRQTSITTLIILTDKKRLNAQQREKVCDSMVMVLRTKDNSEYNLVSLYALREVRSLRDQRFIPYVLPYLSSDNPKVRAAARKTLDRLGYKS